MNALLILVALLAAAAVGLLAFALRGLVQSVEVDQRNYQDPLPLLLRILWPLITVATRLAGPRLSSAQLERAHRSLQSAGQDFVRANSDWSLFPARLKATLAEADPPPAEAGPARVAPAAAPARADRIAVAAGQT